jgi:hypothetical protein
MVTWQPIFSFLLIPKLLIVNEALENIGFYPLKSSKTLAALDNLSPDSPTQQLITNLAIFISLIGFSLVLLSVVAIWCFVTPQICQETSMERAPLALLASCGLAQVTWSCMLAHQRCSRNMLTNAANMAPHIGMPTQREHPSVVHMPGG